jgi:hypothetical protein
MVDSCHACGAQPDVPRQCNHCKKSVCQEHLLPENHNCVALTTRVSDEWFSDGRDPPILGSKSGDDSATDAPASSPTGKTTTLNDETGTAERQQRSVSSSPAATSSRDPATHQTQGDAQQRGSAAKQSTPNQTESVSSPIASQVTTVVVDAARTVWELIAAALRLVAVIGVWAAAAWTVWRAVTVGIQPGPLWRPVTVVVGGLALLRLTQQS